MKAFALTIIILFLNPPSSRKDYLIISKSSLQDKIKGVWAAQWYAVQHQPENIVASTDSLFVGGVDTREQLIEQHLTSDLLILQAATQDSLNLREQFAALYRSSNLLSGHGSRIVTHHLNQKTPAALAGRWLNNPHAEDADFVKSSEVIGLLAPGILSSVTGIADAVGHVTSSGEGYYAGLYTSSIISMGFFYDDPATAIGEALHVIPSRSDFHKCMHDIMQQYKARKLSYENLWAYVEKEWKKVSGCPSGENLLEHDGRTYAAFVTMALLLTSADPEQIVDLLSKMPEASATLPSLLAVSGVIHGFNKLPEYMKEASDREMVLTQHADFARLDDLVSVTYDYALKSIKSADGKIKPDHIMIPVKVPAPVKPERCFDAHYISKVEKINFVPSADNDLEFSFEGVGLLIRGYSRANEATPVFAELYLNGKYIDRIQLPQGDHEVVDLCWQFQLPHKSYKGRLKVINPENIEHLTFTDIVAYNIHPPVIERKIQ
jgi:hypothetical protein